MTNRQFTILQVCPTDTGGGAELTAYQLHLAFKEFGHKSFMIVDSKDRLDDSIFTINNDRYRNAWIKFWNKLIFQYDRSKFNLKGLGRALRGLKSLGELRRMWRINQGYEDFDYPGSAYLLHQIPFDVDVVHFHNLHGNYFDLRQLVELSAQKPVIITMHDAWLLTGHCAHSFGCKRWQTGCGSCPDLSLYPSVENDKTAENWMLKKSIFAESNIHIVSPIQLLMNSVDESFLGSLARSKSVIPNSVDTKIFYPRNQYEVRAEFGINQASDVTVLMIAANSIDHNPFKDFAIFKQAIADLPKDINVEVIAVGRDSEDEYIGNIRIRSIAYQADANHMAKLYSASDIFVHCAKVEVFCNVLIEARACGTPIIASAVGGISEHVKCFKCEPALKGLDTVGADQADGILCEKSNYKVISEAIQILVKSPSLRKQFGANGLRNITHNYTQERQVSSQISLYQNIIDGSV